MNMCREVRHAAALLMQRLRSLRALDDGFVSGIKGYEVPPDYGLAWRATAAQSAPASTGVGTGTIRRRCDSTT